MDIEIYKQNESAEAFKSGVPAPSEAVLGPFFQKIVDPFLPHEDPGPSLVIWAMPESKRSFSIDVFPYTEKPSYDLETRGD